MARTLTQQIVLEDMNPLDIDAILKDNSNNSPVEVYELRVLKIGEKFYNVLDSAPRKLRYA